MTDDPNSFHRSAPPSDNGTHGSDNDGGSKSASLSSGPTSRSSKAASRPATIALIALALASVASAALFTFDGTVREGPPIPNSYPYTWNLYKVGSPFVLLLTKGGLLALAPCACAAGLVSRTRPAAVAASALSALANAVALTGTFFSAVSLNKAWGGTGFRFVVPVLFAIALTAAVIDLRNKITYVRTEAVRARTVKTWAVQTPEAQTQTDDAATASAEKSSEETEKQALADGASSTAERKSDSSRTRFWKVSATPAVLELFALTAATGFVVIPFLVLDGGISGDVFTLLSNPPQCISSQAAELFVIFMTGWALLALIPCAYATAIVALSRRTTVASSIASVTVNALALACTLPTAFVVLSQYGTGAFLVAFPVPVFFAMALVGAGADLRKKIKAI